MSLKITVKPLKENHNQNVKEKVSLWPFISIVDQKPVGKSLSTSIITFLRELTREEQSDGPSICFRELYKKFMTKYSQKTLNACKQET